MLKVFFGSEASDGACCENGFNVSASDAEELYPSCSKTDGLHSYSGSSRRRPRLTVQSIQSTFKVHRGAGLDCSHWIPMDELNKDVT